MTDEDRDAARGDYLYDQHVNRDDHDAIDMAVERQRTESSPAYVSAPSSADVGLVDPWADINRGWRTWNARDALVLFGKLLVTVGGGT